MDLYTVRNNVMKGKNFQDLNLRVVFYARVSTDKDEQLHSLKSQISFFHEYISKIPNWEFIDSYIDEGLSGTRVNKREEFLRMIDESKQDKFDLILTKEISRFSRNTLDSIKYTQELLKNGVGVYFLNDNINTILPDSELRLTIMASVAQDEVRKLSERVSFGMKRSIDNGVVLGCSNIYGYVKDHGKLVIDEKEAEMIRTIFDRYANTNEGVSKISRYLYSLGYKTKTGKRLDTTIITRILENPKYKGYYCGHKSKILDYRTKQKKRLSKDEWIIYKDEKNIPPIVSEELWDRANKKLKIRQASYVNKVENKALFLARYTYSGKIYCARHNVTYHRAASGKRKNNPVWECQIYRKESLKGCNNPRVLELEIDELFIKLFTNLFKDKKTIFNDLLDECKNYLESEKSYNKKNALQNKLTLLNDKKDKLLELVMDGYLEKSEYKKQIDKLNNSLQEIKRALTNIKNNEKNIVEEIELIKERLTNALNNKTCFNNIFNELVEKIIVYKLNPENKKQVKLTILFKTGEIVNASSNYLGKRYHLEDSYTTSSSSIRSC